MNIFTIYIKNIKITVIFAKSEKGFCLDLKIKKIPDGYCPAGSFIKLTLMLRILSLIIIVTCASLERKKVYLKISARVFYSSFSPLNSDAFYLENILNNNDNHEENYAWM